ncbi:hypothetical protein [Chitinibacter tainanensis]|uniref:hypothetical protein n=1 Tax=Chitinibacter tainanensis TaxID=230667 RepID=UPI00041344C4|nr:hypothetical protein [Chitinibacter tainanensis]
MLTYTPPESRPLVPQKEQDKPWLLILLCLFWLLPGLFGHDPWKPQENEHAAVIAGLLRHNPWVVPLLADQPYFDSAPLYFWCAAIVANALSWFGVALHDAARFSTGLWMALACWGAGLAGREAFGHRFGRLTVVLLLGSLGLLTWGHHISPAVLPLTAFAWGIYALLLAQRRPVSAGLVLGVSLLTLLLGATWADALLLLLVALGLLVWPAWRQAGFAVTLVTALIVSLPLAALWGYALHEHSSELFQHWWRNYAWGPYGGAGQVVWLHQPGFLLSILVWFAFPVLPLAAWSLWLHRRELQQGPWPLLCWLALGITLYIALAGHPAEFTVLPLLLPLSLLAAAGVDDLRRGAASALNSFAILTLGLAAVAIWVIWGILLSGGQGPVAVWLARYTSAAMQIEWVGFVLALVASLLWGKVLLRPRALGRKAITNWTCGVILVFSVLVGLFQGWIDSGKSYRPVVQRIELLTARVQPPCIDASNLHSPVVGALSYFSTKPVITQPGNACIVAVRLASTPIPLPWSELGEVARLGESKERFVVYLK